MRVRRRNGLPLLPCISKVCAFPIDKAGRLGGPSGLLKRSLQNLVVRAGGQPLRLGAWRAHDRELGRRFAGGGAEEQSSYVWLVRYLLTGFLEWRSQDGARAIYPGLLSHHGADIDAIEGFSRFAPLIAAWLAGGRPAMLETLDGKPADLAELLRQGLVAGTDPDGPGYWGLPGKTDQRICEGADIALSLWLARDWVWTQLDAAEQDRILAWLRALALLRVHDNNWHFFPLLILLVLRHFKAKNLPADGLGHFPRIRDFHLGAGWYADGQPLKIDYYNAWGFHYPLFWLGELAPGRDPAILGEELREFATSLSFLISPSGLPMIGRSITYRMALPAPLIAAQRRHPETIPAGLARRALAAVWSYFIGRGALRAGIVTQGYEASEPDLVDAYSGPASPLWSLRSLVLAFYEPPDSPFWTAPLQPLPIEARDYSLPIPSIGWRIEGRHATGEIVIKREGRTDDARFERLSWRERLRALRGLPAERPANNSARYLRAEYSSARPFWREPG
jgi:hypothetical protein